MEWIEGVTLSKVCQSLAVDDEGRLSPLTAARIGRDLFDLLSRMDALAGEFVHRDISPANILVRTSHLSINEQAEEECLISRLIDFGSAVYFGESKKSEGALQDPLANGGAVSSYAAPELLEGAPKQSEKSSHVSFIGCICGIKRTIRISLRTSAVSVVYRRMHEWRRKRCDQANYKPAVAHAFNL